MFLRYKNLWKCWVALQDLFFLTKMLPESDYAPQNHLMEKQALRKNLCLYNTLSRKKEPFVSVHKDRVGIYVCGPTVYSPIHVGNVRTFLFFDVLVRYFRYLGFQTTYVRNITDVGHLLSDSDESEDKIARQARKEGRHPMAVAQHYTRHFEEVMRLFQIDPPDLAPTATGHLIEQQQWIRHLLEKRCAYVSGGSVYFDLKHHLKHHPYGTLSGRKIEELQAATRTLQGIHEKRFSLDFALWKKAPPNHLMRWPSDWGEGFPGWHLECSVMSQTYLGSPFDIHGGGIDLIFPHHECEIAQSVAHTGKVPVKYWMHTNMVTLKGKKMSKSDTDTLPLLSSFEHPLALRLLMLQTHYRSTLDFSEKAVQDAKKSHTKLLNGFKTLMSVLPASSDAGKDINVDLDARLRKTCERVWEALNDDVNTALALGHLFDILSFVHQVENGQCTFSQLSFETHRLLSKTFSVVVQNIFNLVPDKTSQGTQTQHPMLVQELVDMYVHFKKNRDYDAVERIRMLFQHSGLALQDKKDGTVSWKYAAL